MRNCKGEGLDAARARGRSTLVKEDILIYEQKDKVEA